MDEIFIDNPIMLLFIVAASGSLLGRIKIKGYSLGVAGVLFTGLIFGSLNLDLDIPREIFLLGLAIYVYSIGLSSGPAFFNSYKKHGLRDLFFFISCLGLTGIVAVFMTIYFGFSAATITGIYTGTTTNTPALVSIVEYMNNQTIFEDVGTEMRNEAVVGYSYSYLMGVIGVIAAIITSEKIFKIDYKKEYKKLKPIYPFEERLASISVKVTNEKICDIPLRNLYKRYQWNVIFGRMFKNGKIALANWDTELSLDDIIMVIGSKEDLDTVKEKLGEKDKTGVTSDRTRYDARTIFVSNGSVAGKNVASLNLTEKYNAVITRIRRGDVEILAMGDTVFELGDRVRFIAKYEDLNSLSKLFGDSYYESSRVNIFSFGIGIGIGIMLGNIDFSIGDNLSFKLGYAGGPLIMGLILGAIRRTGDIVWTLPYSANITLQQLGLIMLLSFLGVSSGHTLINTLDMQGIKILFASIFLSLFTSFTMIIIGYKLFKIPFSILTGMISNQPAILDFATMRSKNKIPTFGYSVIFPIAHVCKILLSQILLLYLLSNGYY